MGNLPSEKTLVLFCFLPFLLFMQHDLEPRYPPSTLALSCRLFFRRGIMSHEPTVISKMSMTLQIAWGSLLS